MAEPWPAATLAGEHRPADQTLVCTTTTASDPTILAARREMQSWKLIDPRALGDAESRSVLREAVRRHQRRPPGRGALPVRHEPRGGGKTEPDRVYNAVATRLAELVEATAVKVDRDDRRELLTLLVEAGARVRLPPRDRSRTARCDSSRYASSTTIQRSRASSAWRSPRTASTPSGSQRWSISSVVWRSISSARPEKTTHFARRSSIPTSASCSRRTRRTCSLPSRSPCGALTVARRTRCAFFSHRETWRTHDGERGVGARRFWRTSPRFRARGSSRSQTWRGRPLTTPETCGAVHTFLLVCEGSSDRGLVPHLESLCVRAGATEALAMPLISEACRCHSGKPSPIRSAPSLKLGAELDILFVHRDADCPDPQAVRRRQIADAVALRPAVRSTCAWSRSRKSRPGCSPMRTPSARSPAIPGDVSRSACPRPGRSRERRTPWRSSRRYDLERAIRN